MCTKGTKCLWPKTEGNKRVLNGAGPLTWKQQSEHCANDWAAPSDHQPQVKLQSLDGGWSFCWVIYSMKKWNRLGLVCLVQTARRVAGWHGFIGSKIFLGPTNGCWSSYPRIHARRTISMTKIADAWPQTGSAEGGRVWRKDMQVPAQRSTQYMCSTYLVAKKKWFPSCLAILSFDLHAAPCACDLGLRH